MQKIKKLFHKGIITVCFSYKNRITNFHLKIKSLIFYISRNSLFDYISEYYATNQKFFFAEKIKTFILYNIFK